MADSFQVGDVVRHRSGGRLAVVVAVQPGRMLLEFWAEDRLVRHELHDDASLAAWRLAERSEIERAS